MTTGDRFHVRLLVVTAGLVIAAIVQAWGQQAKPRPIPLLNNPIVDYFDRQPDDAIARLQAQIDSGTVKIEFRPAQTGYLPALLKALDVNVDSQVLAFAKNSAQPLLISPQAPRAIFFNDTVAIGSVKNSEVLELAALDANQGVNFYTLRNVPTPGIPKFQPEAASCLQCHMDESNHYVAGLTVMSVYPAPDGTGLVGAFSFTDHRTPLEERWGGWYVTGTHGAQQHRGNAVARDPYHPADLETVGTQNLTSLAAKFDATGYLAPTSDIVALMTLEHQTRMTNLITLVGWQARVALSRSGSQDSEAARRLDTAIGDLVTYMLFADEAPLHEPVQGVSSFTKTFPQRGPLDGKGRSLRDFDLRTRLFRYPLSYMVYSEAFDSIPDVAREMIYRRLYDVLVGRDTSARFAKLSAAERRAVLEILLDTKENLPAYWEAP